MQETTKSNKRRYESLDFWNNVMTGEVLDIGCGDDPLKAGTFKIEKVRTFDMQDGDANNITRYIRNQFDTVYGSQVLEHMWNPPGSLFQWWSLVKPGGHMVITVPEVDLYEQGHWPSKYNTDHKWQFAIEDKKFAHPNRVIRFDHLVDMLPNGNVLRCAVVDTNYDYEKEDVDQTLGDAEAWLEAVIRREP